MPKTIICKNCGKEVPANIRLKGCQQYCGDPACQCARKTAWQRAKKAKDADYCVRQKQSGKNWQDNKPAHKYQDQYRQDHPGYVAKNREQQKVRNQKRRKKACQQKIVKMDALQTQPEKTTGYIMTQYKMDASKKIVKMDTLFVQLKAFHGDKQTFFKSLP
ncbi:hypothetical protein H8E88_29060 [candidate division KSB1 bacterium]|nr:hypothetical protein [candidate division KSB1 bacterium]